MCSHLPARNAEKRPAKADYERLGVNPSKVVAWEDGLRDTADPMHGEIWYMDCSFGDGSTLVVGFRPKSTDWLPQPTYNPNVAINYNEAGSEIPFCDYRLYEMDQVSMSKEYSMYNFITYKIGEFDAVDNAPYLLRARFDGKLLV